MIGNAAGNAQQEESQVAGAGLLILKSRTREVYSIRAGQPEVRICGCLPIGLRKKARQTDQPTAYQWGHPGWPAATSQLMRSRHSSHCVATRRRELLKRAGAEAGMSDTLILLTLTLPEVLNAKDCCVGTVGRQDTWATGEVSILPLPLRVTIIQIIISPDTINAQFC